MPKVTVSVRIDAEMAEQLPVQKKARAAFLRNAIHGAIAGRTVPAPEEVDQLRQLVRELRPIGRNVNQVVHSIHYARQNGRDIAVPGRLLDLAETAIARAEDAARVLAYWES